MTIAAFLWAGLATIGAMAAGIIQWRSSAGRESSRLWQENAVAYKAKAERLEEMVVDLTRRVEHIEAENAVLRTLHDNGTEIASLRQLVSDGFTQLKYRLEHDA